MPPRLMPGTLCIPVAVECATFSGRRAAAVLDDDHVVGVLYAAHLEAALRRATAGRGVSSAQR